MVREISATLAQDFPKGVGLEVIEKQGCFYMKSVCMTAASIIVNEAVLEPSG